MSYLNISKPELYTCITKMIACFIFNKIIIFVVIKHVKELQNMFDLIVLVPMIQL